MGENRYGESRWYDTNPDDPDAPERLLVYKGMRDGDRVKYVGSMPLEGVFRIDEIVQFASNDVLAVIREESTEELFEVNADNLEKL